MTDGGLTAHHIGHGTTLATVLGEYVGDELAVIVSAPRRSLINLSRPSGVLSFTSLQQFWGSALTVAVLCASIVAPISPGVILMPLSIKDRWPATSLSLRPARSSRRGRTHGRAWAERLATGDGFGRRQDPLLPPSTHRALSTVRQSSFVRATTAQKKAV